MGFMWIYWALFLQTKEERKSRGAREMNEKEKLKQEGEELEEWLEEQKGNSKSIIVHRGNATKEEWLELLEYIEEKLWDYDE